MKLEINSKESNNFYTTFLGFLIKKGGTHKAKKVLDNTFLAVTQKIKYSKCASLIKLFRSLNSFVEVKKVRVRRRFVLVPFPINLKRRSYLIVKWIMQTVQKDKKKSSFSKKTCKRNYKRIEEYFFKDKKIKTFKFFSSFSKQI